MIESNFKFSLKLIFYSIVLIIPICFVITGCQRDKNKKRKSTSCIGTLCDSQGSYPRHKRAKYKKNPGLGDLPSLPEPRTSDREHRDRRTDDYVDDRQNPNQSSKKTNSQSSPYITPPGRNGLILDQQSSNYQFHTTPCSLDLDCVMKLVIDYNNHQNNKNISIDSNFIDNHDHLYNLADDHLGFFVAVEDKSTNQLSNHYNFTSDLYSFFDNKDQLSSVQIHLDQNTFEIFDMLLMSHVIQGTDSELNYFLTLQYKDQKTKFAIEQSSMDSFSFGSISAIFGIGVDDQITDQLSCEKDCLQHSLVFAKQIYHWIELDHS